MRKFALLIGTAAMVVCLGTASSWAVTVDNIVYVDPEQGTDVSNTTCGQFGAGASTGPCATLNLALQNLPATGGVVVIEKPGTFGPIILTAGVSISGPENGAAFIDFRAATLPGCLNGAPGSCNGSANATYAVDVQAGATNTVKFKNVLINSSGTSAAALHISTAFGVSLAKTALRCGGGTNTPETMLIDSSQGSQMQVYIANSDIAFCGGGGGIVVAPTGTTSVRMNFNNSEVHNAAFGLQANSTGLTGNANIQILVDNTQFFSFNNSAISLTSSASTNGAAVSLTRSAIINTGGAALKANGAGAGGVLYESAIIGNAVGVNVVNGAGVFTYQNNEIIFNGVPCEVNSAPTACSTALTATAAQ